ncbi:hypothetical protein AVEN_237714-1 [Araneus ventricosus]|uniref:Uncharacterized protein n=1 Tax=Araneus ventricosus TaxID=182803 RepID=A0A4Y2QDN0_ARAVE|nr:hypothetical protein AVEN_237714-1 [Araneus ventricosus]
MARPSAGTRLKASPHHMKIADIRQDRDRLMYSDFYCPQNWRPEQGGSMTTHQDNYTRRVGVLSSLPNMAYFVLQNIVKKTEYSFLTPFAR